MSFMKPPFKMLITNEIEQWRWDTFWTKEPETIEWIKSFQDGDIFFDVGANVGIYSLYCAAIYPNCAIWSFEPDENNYFRLCENIKLNLTSRIFPLNAIIANRDGKMGFKNFSLQTGISGGQMIEEGEKACFKIDSFFTVPNHIKIDIDGQEWKVVQGMAEILKNKNLKSVLIEINDHRDLIIQTFIENGFEIDNKFNKMENHSRIRRAKEGIKAENIVFTRTKK